MKSLQLIVVLISKNLNPCGEKFKNIRESF